MLIKIKLFDKNKNQGKFLLHTWPGVIALWPSSRRISNLLFRDLKTLQGTKGFLCWNLNTQSNVYPLLNASGSLLIQCASDVITNSENKAGWSLPGT